MKTVAPTLTVTATPLNYVENRQSQIDTDVTVVDSDSATLVNVTVRIIGGYVSGEDELRFFNAMGVRRAASIARPGRSR